MEKVVANELDFILDPTYKKVSKVVTTITKEIINTVGKQYSQIINDRILKTNFVFYNKTTDLKKYCETNSKILKNLDSKKIRDKYELVLKKIEDYDAKVSKLNKKLKTNFINDIKDSLSDKDKTYLENHSRIDFTKLDCYKIFFDDKKEDNLINGIFIYFSNEYEKKINDKKTSINEIELIFNNREKCLKLLGVKNVNVKVFDRESFNYLLEIIDKYNKEYNKNCEEINLDKKQIIDDYLLNEKVLADTKNEKVSKYFKKLLKNNKKEISKINNKIVNKISKSKQPEIVWASDNCSDDNNMRFLLFSGTLNYEANDFLFVRQICRLAFNSENYNTSSIVQDNNIIGREKYLMFSNLVIDFLAYQITKKLTKDNSTIINHKPNKNIVDFNEGLFLIEKFYLDYTNKTIESLITNDKRYICEEIGESNFENFVNIINKYYYDYHGNLLTEKERTKESFIKIIKNILNISLENMKQYRKILINKEKYSLKI